MTRPGGNAARDREIWLRRRRDALSYAALAGLWPLSRTRLEQIVAREDRRASVAFGDWRRAHPEKHGPAGDDAALAAVAADLGISAKTLEAIVWGRTLPRGTASGVAERPGSG